MFKSTLNQAYLGTAIILLLLVLLASNPCKKLKYKALHDSDIDKKTIRIQTKDDIIFMDPNSVDIYLKRIKFNLLKLSNIKPIKIGIGIAIARIVITKIGIAGFETA